MIAGKVSVENPEPEIAATEDAETARGQVRVGPALAHGITTVTKTDIALTASVGDSSDDQRVLIPFLECALYGSGGSGELVWTGRLAMDNVAFLIEQVSVGLSEALQPLEAMSLGDLKPPSARIEYAADKVASASESLRDAAATLRSMASRRV
jgi:hypothetical protein